MNWQLLVPLLITTIAAVGGWFVCHLLNARRDKTNKKREQRISYLIEAYRRLEFCAHRKELKPDDLESALADIQLFGSARQVELSLNFGKEFAAQGNAEFDALLRDLRQDLRRELQLETVPERIW